MIEFYLIMKHIAQFKIILHYFPWYNENELSCASLYMFHIIYTEQVICKLLRKLKTHTTSENNLQQLSLADTV